MVVNNFKHNFYCIIFLPKAANDMTIINIQATIDAKKCTKEIVINENTESKDE